MQNNPNRRRRPSPNQQQRPANTATVNTDNQQRRRPNPNQKNQPHQQGNRAASVKTDGNKKKEPVMTKDDES